MRAQTLAPPNVLTWHNDNARSGQNLQESVLTPANVNSTTFGKLFTLSVDGKVDAQPLYVSSMSIVGALHNVLFVATEHDSVYAFDADTGAQLWQVSVLGPGEVPSDNRGCSQVTPEMGVTATPVIDLAIGPHGTLYLIAMSKAGSVYHHRLHALDLTNGAEQFSGPIEIAATFPGHGVEGSSTTQTFAASQHKERPGLLIVNGIVYTTWGSHCDAGPYTGWVIGYDESTLAQKGVLNLTPNGNDGGIWMAGAGPVADVAGNLYLLTGNGTFDTTLSAGFPNQGDFGNAFVKIHVAANGALSVEDYFTMFNTTSESGADQDLGSGGAILLPSLLDTGGQPRVLAVGAGKDQNIYVVDTNDMMGRFNPNTDIIYQQMSAAVAGGVFSSPAWFNGTMYYGAVGDHIRAFRFANGTFSTTPASQSSHTFPFPGTTPSISANGTQNAILWAAENTSPAVLHAYDATNLATELYNSNQASGARDQFGSGNKFIVPTITNGKVYVGTTNGVGVFGLLCSYSVLPTQISVPAARNSGQISLTATSGCAWSASSDSSWLTVTSGSPGTGSGSIGYSAAANSGFTTRVGTITAGGRTFVVTQAGLASSCTFSISPAAVTAPAAAATGSISVTTQTGCTWTIVTHDSWLTSATSSGADSGSLGYSIAANPTGAPRTGTISIADQTFTAVQSAAGVALRFVPVTPCRIADTRNPAGPFGGPALTANTPRDFAIPSSACGIPANAAAYSLNLTVVPLQPLGFLQVYPSGQSQPGVSTLNSPDGRTKANAAIVPAGINGAITLFATNPTHAIIDISGYFVADPAGQALAFYPVAPCRIADTRNATGAFGGPALEPDVSRDFPLQASSCGIPASARAYALNMTVVPSGPLGFLTAWPSGTSQPGVSTLNAPTGAITANAAMVQAGTNGAIRVIATDATNLIIDIDGYFAPVGAPGSLSFFPLIPCRVIDTRSTTILAAATPRNIDVIGSVCSAPSTARAYSLNATVVPPAGLGFLQLWNTGGPQPAVSTLNASDGLITSNAAIVPAGAGGSVTAYASNATHLILDINGYFAP